MKTDSQILAGLERTREEERLQPQLPDWFIEGMLNRFPKAKVVFGKHPDRVGVFEVTVEHGYVDAIYGTLTDKQLLAADSLEPNARDDWLTEFSKGFRA